MNISRRLVAALAAATLLLSACGSDDTADTSSTAATSDPSGPASAGTSPAVESTMIGGDVDTLDETSATWFSAMCDGMAPLVTGLQSLPNQPAETASFVETLGVGLTEASDNLAALDPPTFEGGAEYAAAAVTSFSELGTKFQTASEQLAAGDTAGLAALSQGMSESPLSAMADSFNPELHDDIQALPSCAPFFSM